MKLRLMCSIPRIRTSTAGASTPGARTPETKLEAVAQPKEQPGEQPKEQSGEQPKEQSGEQPEEQPVQFFYFDRNWPFDDPQIGPHDKKVPFTVNGKTEQVDLGYLLLLQGTKPAGIYLDLTRKQKAELMKAGLKFFPFTTRSRHKDLIVTQPGEEWRAERLKAIETSELYRCVRTWDIKKYIKLEKEMGELLGYAKADIQHYIKTRFPPDHIKKVMNSLEKKQRKLFNKLDDLFGFNHFDNLEYF